MSLTPLASPLEDYFGEEIDVSSVKGSASFETKRHLAVLFRVFRSRTKTGFADNVGENTDIVSVDVERVGEKNKKFRSTVICECTVTAGRSITLTQLSQSDRFETCVQIC